MVRPPGEDNTEQPYLDQKAAAPLIANITQKFQFWRDMKRPFEAQAFINAAMLRGNQDIGWDDQRGHLTKSRSRTSMLRPINRILPKILNRRARIIKPQPRPAVVAATSNHQDKLDARASERALLYVHRKCQISEKYISIVRKAEVGGKAFMWVGWDPSQSAHIRIEMPGMPSMVVEAPPGSEAGGDVTVEAGSLWEVFVPNMELERIGDQPEIIRARVLHVAAARKRFPQYAADIKGTVSQDEAFHYQRQLASLTQRSGFSGTADTKDDRQKEYVLLLEWFERPTLDTPHGRYATICGNVLVDYADELPGGFFDMENPFPVVEFSDIPATDQFWSMTLIEQLIGPQVEYNEARHRLREYLRLLTQPKAIVPKSAQIGKATMTNAAGEFVPYVWLPGMPDPQRWFVTPPQVSPDLWRAMDLLRGEVDDLSQVHPVAEGKAGTTKSGFQANLLQEASDENIEPIRNAHARALEEVFLKLRRLMRLHYTVPRLITVIGPNRQAEVEEFSAEDIDERAEIVVQVQSGLPDLKSARIQAVLELYEKGLLGDPADPSTKRKALATLDLGSDDEHIDRAKVDEQMARNENKKFSTGQPVGPPQFFENHQIHVEEHTNELKSLDQELMPPDEKMGRIAHIIQHIGFINPQEAPNLARLYGLPIEILPLNMLMQQQAQQAAPPTMPPPGAPLGAPPPGVPGSMPPGMPPPPAPAPSAPPMVM